MTLRENVIEIKECNGCKGRATESGGEVTEGTRLGGGSPTLPASCLLTRVWLHVIVKLWGRTLHIDKHK